MTGDPPDADGSPGVPPWMAVLGILVILLVLVVAVAMLTGGHGPGVHSP